MDLRVNIDIRIRRLRYDGHWCCFRLLSLFIPGNGIHDHVEELLPLFDVRTEITDHLGDGSFV